MNSSEGRVCILNAKQERSSPGQVGGGMGQIVNLNDRVSRYACLVLAVVKTCRRTTMNLDPGTSGTNQGYQSWISSLLFPTTSSSISTIYQNRNGGSETLTYNLFVRQQSSAHTSPHIDKADVSQFGNDKRVRHTLPVDPLNRLLARTANG